MKISLTTCALTLSALLAGNAMAGDTPGSDGAAPGASNGPHGLMRADTNGDGKVSKEEAAALHDKMQGDWFDQGRRQQGRLPHRRRDSPGTRFSSRPHARRDEGAHGRAFQGSRHQQ